MTSILRQILTIHLTVFGYVSAKPPSLVVRPPTLKLSGRCAGLAHNYQRAVSDLASCAALCDCDVRCDYWSYYCSAGGARGPHQAHCYLYPRHECTSLLYKGAQSPWVTGHYSTLSPSCPWLFNKIFLWNGIVL